MAPGAFPASKLDSITMMSESGGNRYARSMKGAFGLMQVMPATARDPGFGLTPANPNDPNDAARLGREYRAKMQARYGNDPAKMWAAYNWGPGNLDAALARYGDNWLAAAPAETQAYVRRNMQSLRNR